MSGSRKKLDTLAGTEARLVLHQQRYTGPWPILDKGVPLQTAYTKVRRRLGMPEIVRMITSNVKSCTGVERDVRTSDGYHYELGIRFRSHEDGELLAVLPRLDTDKDLERPIVFYAKGLVGYVGLGQATEILFNFFDAHAKA